jgi:N-acetyl-beta-hexosaminidase
MAAPTNNNTLTNLIPDTYAALDVVARELVGFIPAVTRDMGADRVAVGQTLRVPQTPANAAGRDIVPAMAFSVAEIGRAHV